MQTILQVEKKRILVTVSDTSDSITILMGGRHHHCIHVSLTKPESPFAAFTDFHTGYIVELTYNQACDLEKQFQRSIDTQMILRLMIAYIKEKYPFVTRLQFTDASYRNCDNGTTVELPEMYYIVSGQTWYQERFAAYMADDDQAKFAAATTAFQGKKVLIPWPVMQRIMDTDDTWKELYETTATWQEFFGPIRSQLGAAEFCTFVAPWLHTFLLKTLRFRFMSIPFYIDIEAAPVVRYVEAPYIGGRRQTSKRPKRRPLNET